MTHRRSKQRKLLLEQLEDRLTPTTFGQVWPDPGHLTLSFVPDGTNVGGASSNLFQTLNAQAPTSSWESEILRAFQTWAVNTNVNIGVVADAGQSLGTTGAVQGDSRFGDIRIGAKPLPAASVSTASPFSWTGTTWSGDLLLNSLYNFGIGGKGQYNLYTVALHEAGHVFGLDDNHTDTQSAMYDSYIGPRTGLAPEDVSAIQALYGVRQADPSEQHGGNNNFSSATPIANASLQQTQTVGADISSHCDVDYWKITTPLALGITGITFNIKTSSVSLLEPSISVFDANHNLLASATASSPLNNDLSVTIHNVGLLRTYYFEVAGATPGVFGIGSYLANATYQYNNGLISTVVKGLVGFVGNTLNDTLATATWLLPAFPGKTDRRFDYLYRANLSASSGKDYYGFAAPAGPAGATETLNILTWAADVSGLHPVVHVFDANGNPTPVQVLSNAAGLYSLQVPNAPLNTVYYAEVTALNPNGLNNTGNYVLGIKFDSSPPVTLDALDSTSLNSASSSATATLTMNENGLFHFVFGSQATDGSSGEVLTMTVYDENGNAVLSLDSTAGQPPATAIAYLGAGTYTIRYSVKSYSGLFVPIRYWLDGEALSDPVGPYKATVSNSGTSSGGGYTYGGSSSGNTSPSNPPKYY
jgi:hypothetical protein